MRKLLVGLVTMALMAMMLITAAPAQADHYLYDYEYQYHGSYSNNTRGYVKAYVRGYGKDYGCGLKDCAKVRDMYGYVWGYKISSGASLPNRTQMAFKAGFSGASLSVSLGSSGPSYGFSDWGSSCGQASVANNHYYVTRTASGELCKASTWAWVSRIKVWNLGQYRLGWNWYDITAYDSVKVGGW